MECIVLQTYFENAFTLSTDTIWLSRSDAMRTDQFSDWDTDKAKEIDRPASLAKASLFSTAVVSSGPYFLVSLPSTAKRAAKVAIRVPANSSLTANQQFALKFKKKAF